ncbi:hypothetical protein WICMUC_001046 [Wickerhamomyces mucosus]|uniref:DNA polymerase alpha subunit B n=1 Tax=Wickerhamomyces mucosus TaxID=1378264 RepID=A0A9P8PXH8_9ASCO|nr:hypothetical protein WICMUC_001046 [Wickerhamomyces mucosus]
MAQELIQYFGTSLQEEFHPQLLTIAKIFQISINELYINWESFVITKNNDDDKFTAENFDRLQHFIQDKLSKRRQTPSTNKIKKIVKQTFSPYDNTNNNTPSSSILSTPLKKIKTNTGNASSPLIASSPITPSSSLKPQTKSGEIIESLNDDIITINSLTETNPIKLIANFDKAKYSFRSMRTKLLESADVLDEQIEHFITIFQEHYKILISNPSVISQDEIYTVGRIVGDNPNIPITDPLNSQSLSLETSRLLGVGKRIPLDLSKLSNFQIFQGQIICCKGKNPSGESFKISEILTPPLLGSNSLTFDELNFDNDIKISLFKGPYTTNNELNYDKLNKIVFDLNSKNNSNLVILLGPFIDINHPSIIDGDLGEPLEGNPKTLDEYFQKIIVATLRKINPKIHILLIPSLSDTSTKFNSYPQNSISPNLLKNANKNIKSFPNPSIFQINDISIGISNLDIFKNCKDIISNSKQNRFDRIVNYIIEQRKFYPVFPTLESLELPYFGLTEFQSIPDILILPSDLKPFAKIIKNVLVINPGIFLKSYAEVSIKRASDDTITKIDNELYINEIWKRAKVEIIKS